MHYKITAIAENTTYRHNCLSQHGQSILIEVEDYKLLFDVGEVFAGTVHNLKQLGVEIDNVDDILISHRHIDHIGALPNMLSMFKKQRLFLPEQMGESQIKDHPEKYNFLKSDPNGGYDMAISSDEAQKILSYPQAKVVESKGFEISHGIFSTGCIGDWMKEQAIAINQGEMGITVILGCSHPAAKDLINKAKEVTGNEKVRMVLGGMHYTDFSEDEMKQKALELEEMGVEKVIPSHCTTIAGAKVLKEVLGDKVIVSKTGTFGTGNSIILDQDIEAKFV